MAPRFYVDRVLTPDSTIVLPEKPAHHASRVLRMREGDCAVLFDGKGNEAEAILHFFADRTEAQIQTVRQSLTESPLKTVLIQALVSQEKLDWILEKATELGVSKIIVVPAERSVTKLDEKRLAKRLLQWKNTTLSACEQCARSLLPEVAYSPSLKSALSDNKSERNFILAPGARDSLKLTDIQSVTFAVGPEGGFSQTEIEMAQSLGYECALLGPRVLRTETAGLAALAVAQTLAGDFR